MYQSKISNLYDQDKAAPLMGRKAPKWTRKIYLVLCKY